MTKPNEVIRQAQASTIASMHQPSRQISRDLARLDDATAYFGEVVEAVGTLGEQVLIRTAFLRYEARMIAGDDPVLGQDLAEVIDDTKILLRHARLNHFLRATS